MLNNWWRKQWRIENIIATFLSVITITIVRASSLSGWTAIVVALAVIAVIDVVALFISKAIDKKRAALADSIYHYVEDCEPDLYIREWKPIFDKCSKDKNLRYALLNNLGIAYADKGEFATAIRILEDALAEYPPLTAKSTIDYMRVVLTGNLCETLFHAGNTEGVMFYYNQMNWFKGQKIYTEALQAAFDNVQTIDSLFDIEQGNYELAVAHYMNSFQQARAYNILRLMVFSQYCLSKIYHRAGYIHEQERCLEFVAEYGKNLHMANTARRILYNAYE
jgi:tetratricopeptide (TPR) repeat protein